MKVSIGTFRHTDKNIQYVTDAIKSDMISSGPYLEKFESSVASYYNKKYGVMVNSGQSALEVALVLAKHRIGKENLRVAIPATTYAATLWAIVNTNCVPVFVDINNDYVIDYNKIDLDKIDVIMPVDLCGYAAVPPKEILDSGKFIIQDACEAFGNKEASYGDIVCHSFYVSHIITTGSGGMLCLNDQELESYARSYISHGRLFGGDFTKFTDRWVDRFLFDKVGSSYRSNNIDAALGLSQLEDLFYIVHKRKENAMSLVNMFEDSELGNHLIFPDKDYVNNSVFQFFPILYTKDGDRENLLSYLFKNGIDSRVLLSLTNQPIIKSMYGDIEKDYPFSNICNRYGFIIGCHQDLNLEHMEHVIKTLKDYFKE